MIKEDILSEIRRLAAENGGVTPGMKTFGRQTGIRQEEWSGVYWRNWGDAVREAGLSANAMMGRIEDEEFLKSYALLTRELGHIPVKADLQMAKRRNSAFPSTAAFMKRFGSYAKIRSAVVEWCSSRGDFEDVQELLQQSIDRSRRPSPEPTLARSPGFVYLIKHGSRPEYKIGRTHNPIRREGEVRLELPEKIEPIHYIETDDPAGIEGYWHTRFAAKRRQGEWFSLTSDDVRAFKKWKRIS
jgi:hypothetical protein